MRDDIYNTINQNELVIEKNESKVSTLNLEIEKLQGKIEEYEENREAIENLEELLEQKAEQQNNLKAQQIILDECNEEIVGLIKERGSLEQRLQGKFTVPTVILYPGKRAGRTSLRFLGIYPEDGNYRSVHIGG